MIDVHIVKWDNQKLIERTQADRWLDECLDSLKYEPVNIHLVDSVVGNIAAARENGFKQGSSEYVSFVDPDDLVVPGTFQQCLEVLEANPKASGVYTIDELIDQAGNHISFGWAYDQKPFIEMGFPVELTNGMHHLRVFRRKAVEKCLPLKSKMIPEPLLNVEIQRYGPLIHIPIVGYKWRIHGNNTFLKYHPEELTEAIDKVRAWMN